MKKDMLKGYVVGALSTLMIAGAAVPAVAQNIDVMRGVKIFVDDMQLYGAEGFIYDGTTYLPVRKISEALDKPVAWDGKTKSVYIGKHESSTPAVMLADMDYFSSEGEFKNKDTVKDNMGNTYYDVVSIGRGGFPKTEEYLLNGNYSKIKGKVIVEHEDRSKQTYASMVKIYGDDKLLYASPEMKGGTQPKDFDVDLTGVLVLRIETGGDYAIAAPKICLVNTGLYQ